MASGVLGGVSFGYGKGGLIGPFAAAAYANAAAALSTQGYGAVAPMPGKLAVEEFLAEGG